MFINSNPIIYSFSCESILSGTLCNRGKLYITITLFYNDKNLHYSHGGGGGGREGRLDVEFVIQMLCSENCED